MDQVTSIAGQQFREMFSASALWLEKSSADIDALNVFPVPDGDTGTNMMLTMRSAMDEAFRASDNSATEISVAMAKGALMGARGNSGVILSQIWRGIAKGLHKKESITADDFAAALKQASDVAYKGVSNPVEGTMLTVIRDAALAAEKSVDNGTEDIIELLDITVTAAAESVANTPKQLKALRDAGVVDAGGQGVYTILDGALRYLKGETEQMRLRKPQIIVSEISTANPIPQMSSIDEVPFGYCTEFLLKGEKLKPESIRKRLLTKGESLIVVGDENAVRIHVHTLTPGEVVNIATKLGTMHQVSIRNMDEQHQDFLELQKDRIPSTDTAVIAVAAGEGMAEVFGSIGAAGVIPGGQSMNPSTKDILQIVESAPSQKVIILPNNKNIIATANQVQGLTQKNVQVIPTKTIPQGVVALLAFDYEADFKTNAEIMEKALSSVKTIEITQAVKATKINGMKIRRKQPIGLLDGDLIAVGETNLDVINQLLAQLNMEKAEVLTIYHGEDAVLQEIDEISQAIAQVYPSLQLEVIRGGQPHYSYIISVE